MADLILRPVDQRAWPDFERLFESRGGPKACWCMVWRAKGEEAKQTKGCERKDAIKRRVGEGVPIGLLGYVDNEPVAWCSVAPKDSYRELGGPTQPGETVWSLVCFFVRREFRGAGMTEQLIRGAATEARSQGATILEAYPVDPGSPSYRFMGYVPTFERAGFLHVRLAGIRRHVMRLDLQ